MLTQPMESVLNRGLNVCIMPLKLDLTQVLVDFKIFERTMIWREFWYDRADSEYDNSSRIFKSREK